MKTDYVLGAGDVIRVTVFQSPELSLETRIPESGIVSYPLLGAVTLGGLTISQAEQRLADGLLAGKFLKQPQVSILVTQLRGSQASVLGHAVRPGRYSLELANTRLSDLMALAGGVAPDGSDILTVVGTRDGKAIPDADRLPDPLSQLITLHKTSSSRTTTSSMSIACRRSTSTVRCKGPGRCALSGE